MSAARDFLARCRAIFRMNRRPFFPRLCTCGRQLFRRPRAARFGGDGDLRGWYFECRTCKSTLFQPLNPRPARAKSCGCRTDQQCEACLSWP